MSGNRGPRVRTVTQEGILTALQLAGRPCSVDDLYKLLDIDLGDNRERKAVQNRLPPLVKSGRVRVSRAAGRNRYAAVEAAGRELEVVPDLLPVRQAPARTNGHQVMTVEDACVGMLLGMTGRETVPIRRLPELSRWMRQTEELLESLG